MPIPDSATQPTSLDYASTAPRPNSFGSTLRWVIAGLLFLAAVLNYIDRNVLGLLIPTIQGSLKFTDQQYAMVINAFLVAYTIAYVFSGRVVDRLGTRMSMALFVAWWSLANGLTAFSRSVVSLAAYRFLLGLGEAGVYTGAPKVVREWFSPAERGIAVGIYSMGGSIGATIAPLLAVGIASRWGWQQAFVLTGAMGLLWLIPWLCLYRSPAAQTAAILPESAAPASAPVVEGTLSYAPAPPSEANLWKHVLSQPAVWRLMTARLLTDAVWYFFLFWMPKYLHDGRGVPQAKLGMTWVIFLAADIGFLAGGFFSGQLIRRGFLPANSRLWIMLGSACLVPLCFLIPLARTTALCLGLAMVVALAHTAWLSNITALIVDLIPGEILATTFGVIAGGSALGGIAMNQMVAWIIKNYSYNRCFYVLALAHPIAIALVWGLRRRATGTLMHS